MSVDKTYTISSMTTPQPENVTTPKPENVTTPKKNNNPFYRAVVMKREFIISNLGHFEDYNIEVCCLEKRYCLWRFCY